MGERVEQLLDPCAGIPGHGLRGVPGDEAARVADQHGGIAGDEERGEQRAVAVVTGVAVELLGQGALQAGAQLPGPREQRGGGRDRRGGDDVSVYAAPARATDLTGLPATCIDCGSAEVFRDETVAFAGTMWAAGVHAELHVWAGGFHGFTGMVPRAALSRTAVSALADWTTRLLAA
ncbi:alpha/beta hydrolase [Symbioplanes lichenis]|uniref:alpha/beta hydrolase n=1 Tax=Symbioplanes lichenis TaxID=1629072 RepID=UPI0027398AA1|nr:alpha/beta hydrolase [Actinoplanes lichenis]